MTHRPQTSATPAVVDPRLIDRLVDGELDAPQRAALLRSLDSEPDGWKRCALGFLEAQAWHAALLEKADSATGDAEAPTRDADRSFLLPAIRRFAGLAAAIVIAFAAGAVTGDGWRFGAKDDEIGRTATPGALVSRDGQLPVAVLEMAGAAPRTDRSLSLPVFDEQSTDARELLRQPTALPEYLRRQLERQGYEVSGDRSLVSVALKDGRHVTVPVEKLKYKYVGHRVY